MSKRKVMQEESAELNWSDDDDPGAVNLATRAAEALEGRFAEDSDAATAGEGVEVDRWGADNGDVEFNEDDVAAIAVTAGGEPSAVVLDDDDGPEEQMSFSAEGTELESFASADIDVVEQLSEERIASIVESMLFATDRPQSVAVLKAAFKGTNVRSHHIRRALDQLQIEYAGVRRGVYLEEVAGGWQLRTKVDNLDFMRRMVRSRPFRLSGPALEVLAIVAYKQPVIKSQIDEIRGVESGHLLRALMEKGLVQFAGKSELPGKPMYYGTSRRFLEIFGLRNLNELPSLSEIDQLLPDGIGDEEEKEKLSDLTGQLAKESAATYSEAEDELLKIATDLERVATTTEFFEQEKARMKAERDAERARDLKEALAVGEEISDTDRRWLDRYERALAPTESVAPANADAHLADEANLAEASKLAEEMTFSHPNVELAAPDEEYREPEAGV